MIFCINCGAQNEPDAVFCLSCGQVLYHDVTDATPKKESSWRSRLLVLALVLAISVVVLISSVFVKAPNARKDNSPGDFKQSPPVVAPVTDKAVLTIVGTDGAGTPMKQGSGFILTPDGLAASNYHVLRGASHAVAECCDGRTFEVRAVEGADFDKDLVVFQLYEGDSQDKPRNLPHVLLGTSQDSKVGDRIITIGSPEGLENTMSDGILSAIREFDTIRLLQITAPISPGSSGGPVFNSTGQVIGITTFQFTKGQNLNFAIAAEHLRPLFNQNLNASLSELDSRASPTPRRQSRVASSENVEQQPATNAKAITALNGQFGGVVHNLSVDVSAQFGMVVIESEGALSGCMGVRQPLFGSGPLSGIVDGPEVTFVVESAIGTITFHGHRDGPEINGTYTVEHQNSATEEGTFTLRRIKSKEPITKIDVAKCPTDAEMNQ